MSNQGLVCIQIVDKTSIQGSDEWLSARKNYRNASETPDVLGVGFKSAKNLKRIKLGLDTQFVSDAMRQGNELEEQVREFAEVHFGEMFSPCVWEFGKYRASLDGLNFSHDTLIEIKVSDKTYESVLDGVVPKNYFYQMQHQMLCSPASKAYLVAYSPTLDKYAVSEPYSLDSVAIKLIEEGWNKYDAIDPLEEDFETTEDTRYKELDIKYFETKQELDLLNSSLKEIKAEMELFADGKNIQAEHTKLRYTQKKGSVDYKKVLKQLDVKIDEDEFRKPSTIYSSITINKS